MDIHLPAFFFFLLKRRHSSKLLLISVIIDVFEHHFSAGQKGQCWGSCFAQQHDDKGAKIINRILYLCFLLRQFSAPQLYLIMDTKKLKTFGIAHRKRRILFVFLRTRSNPRVSDKVWVWVGDGGATLFPIPAASAQCACNSRNFANRPEMGLCPPLPRQPKPQSDTKWNKRKWGMGGAHTERKDVLRAKEKKNMLRTSCKSRPDKVSYSEKTRGISTYAPLKVSVVPGICGHQNIAGGPAWLCILHMSCPLSTVVREDVLASDIYSCASLDYIQSDLLGYLKWYR